MYQRILVPFDGSATARKALVAALQLARNAGGRVRLLHALEALASADGYGMYGVYTGELLKAVRDGGERVLDEGVAIAQSAGVEVDKVLFDEPSQRLGEVVADAAKRWNADLIVVGTHGRRGFSRMFMGSGAEQIIRLAPVPVLVIRDEAVAQG